MCVAKKNKKIAIHRSASSPERAMHRQCDHYSNVCAIILLPAMAGGYTIIHSLSDTHNKLAVEIGCNCTHTHTHSRLFLLYIYIYIAHTHTRIYIYIYDIAQQQLARGRGEVNGSGFNILSSDFL